jgi:hypothetical protein
MSPLEGNVTVTAIGQQGLADHLDRFERAAARVARASPLEAPAEDMVALQREARGVEASMAALRAANEVTGLILDILV